MSWTDPDGSIVILQPQPYSVSNGSVRVRGQFYVPPGSGLQVQLGSGAWHDATIESSTTFSATISDTPLRTGTLTVRHKDTHQAVTVANVSMGKVFWLVGDSNFVGRAANLQSCSLPGSLQCGVFTLAYQWENFTADNMLHGPATDSVADNGIASTTPSGWGSVWPLVASNLATNRGYPVGFVSGSRSGSTAIPSIKTWYPDSVDPSRGSSVEV